MLKLLMILLLGVALVPEVVKGAFTTIDIRNKSGGSMDVVCSLGNDRLERTNMPNDQGFIFTYADTSDGSSYNCIFTKSGTTRQVQVNVHAGCLDQFVTAYYVINSSNIKRNDVQLATY